MIEITIVDYWRYQARYPSNFTLNDENQEYKLNKVHHYHDKIFKEILDNKSEFINFMKQYTTYHLMDMKEENIEKYNRKFVTSSFKIKEADIIYKIKERNVFVMIEHQSTIDYQMPERILEYCIELIRSVRKQSFKEELYPIICPIVLYTGKKKWDAPRSIQEKQESYYGFEPLNYPKYNLISLQEFTKKELIKAHTALSKAMLFEKIKTKEEMKQTLEKLRQKKLNKKEKQILEKILNYSNDVREKIGRLEIAKYKQIFKKGENNSMKDYERFLIEIIDEQIAKYEAAERAGKEAGERKGIKEGIKEGKREGKREGEKIGQKKGIKKVVHQMIKMKLKEEIILEATQINEKELKQIKKELKVG